jgi:hypothetical protein
MKSACLTEDGTLFASRVWESDEQGSFPVLTLTALAFSARACRQTSMSVSSSESFVMASPTVRSEL